MNTPDQSLVVVGYGFMDSHINDIIADAAGTGLKLQIISPLEASSFKSALTSTNALVHRGHEIWEMMSGYHRMSVDEMFPFNASAIPAKTVAFLKHAGLSYK